MYISAQTYLMLVTIDGRPIITDTGYFLLYNGVVRIFEMIPNYPVSNVAVRYIKSKLNQINQPIDWVEVNRETLEFGLDPYDQQFIEMYVTDYEQVHEPSRVTHSERIAHFINLEPKSIESLLQASIDSKKTVKVSKHKALTYSRPKIAQSLL